MKKRKEETVLDTVLNRLEYSFIKDILVKPLGPITITKEVTEQVPTGAKDSDGYNLYDTQVITKEVESNFAKGVILALPTGPTNDGTLKLGDTIVYPKKFAIDFDLFKDSQLVKPYDVIAVVS